MSDWLIDDALYPSSKSGNMLERFMVVSMGTIFSESSQLARTGPIMRDWSLFKGRASRNQ